jgi:Ran GTPase-activating protein (RanGAP) involved in mRNA processing and transport
MSPPLQALLTSTQLERLDLMDTHFGEAGGRVLARAIAQQVAQLTLQSQIYTDYHLRCAFIVIF